MTTHPACSAGLKADRASFPEVSKALEKVALEKGYQLHAPWLNKCIQLYETYLVRHGIMLVRGAGRRVWLAQGRLGFTRRRCIIACCCAAAAPSMGVASTHAGCTTQRPSPGRQVGPSGGGKSAIMECLAGALTEMGTKHVIWRMNPKAITAPQMFGRMDPTTGDWTDGVFAVLWRRCVWGGGSEGVARPCAVGGRAG